MATSWTEFRGQVKSRCSAWTRALWIGRQQWAEQCRRLKEEKAALQERVGELEAALQREREVQRQWREAARCEAAAARSRAASPRLPADPPLAGHGYGPQMISLCVNVARRVGLRATEAVLRTVFEWLGLTAPIPDWTTSRGGGSASRSSRSA